MEDLLITIAILLVNILIWKKVIRLRQESRQESERLRRIQEYRSIHLTKGGKKDGKHSNI